MFIRSSNYDQHNYFVKNVLFIKQWGRKGTKLSHKILILNVVNNQQYESFDYFKGHGPESQRDGLTNGVLAYFKFQKLNK